MGSTESKHGDIAIPRSFKGMKIDKYGDVAYDSARKEIDRIKKLSPKKSPKKSRKRKIRKSKTRKRV